MPPGGTPTTTTTTCCDTHKTPSRHKHTEPRYVRSLALTVANQDLLCVSRLLCVRCLSARVCQGFLSRCSLSLLLLHSRRNMRARVRTQNRWWQAFWSVRTTWHFHPNTTSAQFRPLALEHPASKPASVSTHARTHPLSYLNVSDNIFFSAWTRSELTRTGHTNRHTPTQKASKLSRFRGESVCVQNIYTA